MNKPLITIWNKWSHISAPDNIIANIAALLSCNMKVLGGTKVQTLLTKKNAFKTGFVPLVTKQLNAWNIAYDINDMRSNKFEPNDIITTIPSGDLRERQADVVEKLLSDTSCMRGIVDGATNFGKNWVITALTLSCVKNSKVIITIHRKEVFAQIYDMLIENGIEVSRYGTYKGKMYKELGQCTLAMYQTLQTTITSTEVISHLHSVGTLIVDECHRATSNQYSAVLAKVNAYAVFYLSGTPFTGADECRDVNLIGDSGLVVTRVTNQDLINDGVSQRPIVKIKKLANVTAPLVTYVDELQHMYKSVDRLNFIREVISQDYNKNTLIAVSTKEHGMNLLHSLIDLPTTVAFVYSDDPERDAKIKDFKQGFIQVLITTEILKEGVNFLVRNFINAAQGKSVVWVKQFVGRILRHDGINDDCYVYDFLDASPMLRQQALERITIYEKENFETHII